MPAAATIGAVINPDYPGATVQSDEFREAAGRLGVRPLVFHARTDSEIEAAFARLREGGASALVVSSDPFFNSRRELFPRLASRHALPVIYPQREYVMLTDGRRDVRAGRGGRLRLGMDGVQAQDPGAAVVHRVESRPTSRSPWRIGSTKYPYSRLATGT